MAKVGYRELRTENGQRMRRPTLDLIEAKRTGLAGHGLNMAKARDFLTKAEQCRLKEGLSGHNSGGLDIEVTLQRSLFEVVRREKLTGRRYTFVLEPWGRLNMRFQP